MKSAFSTRQMQREEEQKEKQDDVVNYPSLNVEANLSV
jgi:hypothetical protein